MPRIWGYSLDKIEPKFKNKALLEIKSTINDYIRNNSPKDITIINLYISNNNTQKYVKTHLN